MPRYGELESRALEIIMSLGAEGILQSELWKKLAVSSREGSRLSLRFEKRGLVERRRVLHDGRWTYMLVSKKKGVTIDSIVDCPCLLCGDMEKCSELGDISPITCEKLMEWVAASRGSA